MQGSKPTKPFNSSVSCQITAIYFSKGCIISKTCVVHSLPPGNIMGVFTPNCLASFQRN